MTIEDYLRGTVAHTVTDAAIATILTDRGVAEGTDAGEMEKCLRALCVADLCVWCAGLPGSGGTVEDADGLWKHKESGAQVTATERRLLLRRANEIYRNCGEAPVLRSRVRVESAGMTRRHAHELPAESRGKRY